MHLRLGGGVMTEIKLRNGDYVADGIGGVLRVDGTEALFQRVLFKLTARRGNFPFLKELGSTLYTLSSVPAIHRENAAEQAVAEALAGEKNLRVEKVALEGDELMVQLCYEGSPLDLHLTLS